MQHAEELVIREARVRAASESHTSRARGKLWLAVALPAVMVHPIARALGRVSVACDLISQFQGVALVVTTACMAVAMAHRSRLAWGIGMLALVQSAPMIAPWLPGRAEDRGRVDRPLRLLMANIFFVNQDYDSIRQMIETERPDVVCLLEVSKHHLRNLTELAREYPVRAEYPRHDSHGLALWLRDATDGPVELVRPTPHGAPLIRATVGLGGKRARLFLVHTEMPFVRMRMERGNAELSWLSEQIAAGDGPCIVAGDLNSTDTSRHFEDLLSATGLRDSRQGFGLQPSWPTWSSLRLTIDHVLVSDEVGVVSRRLGEPFGSDHLPVIVDLVADGSTVESSERSVERSSSQP